MNNQSDDSRPKIYVSQRGTRYVKVDELLKSEAAKEVMDKMAKIGTTRKATDRSG